MKWMTMTLTGIVLFIMCSTAGANEWRYPVGPTYVGGFNDVVDLFKDNLRYKGYVVDSSGGVPVGLSFHPYFQWSSGFGMGLGFGPAMAIMVDSSSESYHLVLVPVSLDVRYAVNIEGSVSPYTGAAERICTPTEILRIPCNQVSSALRALNSCGTEKSRWASKRDMILQS